MHLKEIPGESGSIKGKEEKRSDGIQSGRISAGTGLHLAIKKDAEQEMKCEMAPLITTEKLGCSCRSQRLRARPSAA